MLLFFNKYFPHKSTANNGPDALDGTSPSIENTSALGNHFSENCEPGVIILTPPPQQHSSDVALQQQNRQTTKHIRTSTTPAMDKHDILNDGFRDTQLDQNIRLHERNYVSQTRINHNPVNTLNDSKQRDGHTKESSNQQVNVEMVEPEEDLENSEEGFLEGLGAEFNAVADAIGVADVMSKARWFFGSVMTTSNNGDNQDEETQ